MAGALQRSCKAAKPLDLVRSLRDTASEGSRKSRRTMAVHAHHPSPTRLSRRPASHALPRTGTTIVEPERASTGTTWGVAEPRSRPMLDALGVAVYTTDRHGPITFYNGAAPEFRGP